MDFLRAIIPLSTLTVKIRIHIGEIRRSAHRRIVVHKVRHHGRLDASAHAQIERLQHHTSARRCVPAIQDA